MDQYYLGILTVRGFLDQYYLGILTVRGATAAAATAAAAETSTSAQPPVLTPRDEISLSASNLTPISSPGVRAGRLVQVDGVPSPLGL